MPVLLIIIVVVIIVFIGSAAGCSNRGSRKVKIQFTTSETNRTMYTGIGNSVGSAIEDGFSKIYQSLSKSSRIDTITTRLDVMVRTLNKNRSLMENAYIVSCEHYIKLTKSLLRDKQDEEMRKQSERMRRKEENAARKAAEQKAKKESVLCSRIEDASSLPALLAAIEKARLCQDSSGFSASSLQCISNNEEYKVINAYMARVFASINELSLEYVPLPTIKKKVAVWKRSVEQCDDKIPPESQIYYHAEFEKMLGGED